MKAIYRAKISTGVVVFGLLLGANSEASQWCTGKIQNVLMSAKAGTVPVRGFGVV